MEQILTTLGTIASLGAIPLSIYLYLKTKEAKLDKIRKEIVRTLSFQIGEDRPIDVFEIQAVINSKIRENRFKTDVISIDETVEDLVSEIISSPMIDRERKKITLIGLKSIYTKDEIPDNVKDEILDDIKEDNLTWDNLEHKIKDIDRKQEFDEKVSGHERKRKSYERISTWFAIIAAIITIIGVVLSFFGGDSLEQLFQQISQNKVMGTIVLGLASGLITSFLTGLVIKIQKHTQPINKGKSITDDFFMTRKNDENLEETISSNPKNIKYSGGNMNNLISNIINSNGFSRYIIENKDVKVQFLFPDPNNKDVIETLVNHITTDNNKDVYIIEINSAIKKLSEFINRNNLEDRVEYRFYNFVPSFGLKIIDGGKNSRLYVDLYTVGIQKNKRYRLKIEEENSPETYLVFKNQFDELWHRSNIKQNK